MYADQLEAQANMSVKERLKGSTAADFGRRRPVSGKREREDDDKWKHDLFDDNEYKLSSRRVGSKDLHLKLQRKSLEHSAQGARASSSGDARDLREKLSGKLYTRSIENGSLPLRPKPAPGVSRPSRKSVVTEAPVPETRNLASSVSKEKTQHNAESVDNFLLSLDLSKYSITFQAEEVDMTSLVHMSDEDLKALGIPLMPRSRGMGLRWALSRGEGSDSRGGASLVGPQGRGSEGSSVGSHPERERDIRLGEDTTPPSQHASGDDSEDEEIVPPQDPSQRHWCYIVGAKIVSDTDGSHTRVSSVITSIFKKSMHVLGTQFNKIPQQHIDLYFNEFKKFYRWSVDDSVMRMAFFRHGRRRYSGLLHNMKRDRLVKHSIFMPDDMWAVYQEYWHDPDVDTKSKKMSTNRKSEVAGAGTSPSTHSGGSRSSRGWAIELQKELGRPPTHFELMRKTHVRKDGSGFVDERSRRIAEEVEARQLALSESGASEDPNAIYAEVVGTKKQRMYGIGCIASSIVTTARNYTSSSQTENEALRTQVDVLSAQLAAERAA